MNNSSQKANDLYNEGIRHHQSGRLTEAESAYKKAVKINRDFVEALNNLGNVLLDQGRIKEAAGAYRKALKLLPKNPMLLSNLGNALQEQGENKNALRYLREAVANDPDYADAHNNLGNALRELDQWDEAAAAYNQAIKINPRLADTYNNLGGIFVLQEKPEDAVATYERAIEINPRHQDAHNGLGNALSAQDKTDEAIASYRRAIEINPDHKKAYFELGNALSKQDKTDAAIASYRRAIEINPEHHNAYCQLGNALSAQDKTDEAITAYRRAIKLAPKHPAAYLLLGSALSKQEKIDEAIASYRRAIEINPKNQDAYKGLGQILGQHGDQKEAIASFRKALEINPESGSTYQALSTNKKYTEHDDDLRAMEALYSKESISDQQRMHLAFGLGKAHEDLGEYDKSMAFVMEATRLKRASIEYSAAVAGNIFRRTTDAFSLEFFSNHKDTGNPDKTPIFIIGMPRSGTSLTEQILASHPLVFGAGELRTLSTLSIEVSANKAKSGFPECLADFEAMDFFKLGANYIEEIRNYSKSSTYITDKMPHNFLRIGLIKVILPNAKVIFCKRDPMDNCLSIFKNHFAEGHHYSYNLSELGQYYKWYLELMKYWQNTLPGFIYNLSYEQLVTNQEEQTRKLLDFCDLPWDSTCLDFHKTKRRVATASLAQVRRPIHSGSVQLWKRYEHQLEPLRKAIYG